MNPPRRLGQTFAQAKQKGRGEQPPYESDTTPRGARDAPHDERSAKQPGKNDKGPVESGRHWEPMYNGESCHVESCSRVTDAGMGLFWRPARAQTPADYFDKAPPDVDDALRARINGFYQAHVDKKFRQADPYVAEDTKDFYYEANKPAYISFHIDKILYSDNFTKAKAIVTCKMHVVVGFIDQVAMVPTPSTWKLENGQWCWYVDQKAGRDRHSGTGRRKASFARSTLPAMAGAPDVQSLWKNVQADRPSVQLSAKEASSDAVTISSKMAVELRLDAPSVAGLDITLDRTNLKPGEQAKVTFHSEPQENATPIRARVIVHVMPTNQAIPIIVAIK